MTYSIPVLAVILVLMGAMFILRMKYTGIALSFIDIISGLAIMGIAGAKLFTPFNLPLSFVTTAGVVVVGKGVYCLVLSLMR